MHQRLAALFALAAFGVLLLVGLNSKVSGPADNGGRVSFQIAAGPSDGLFFAVSQTIAGLLSHPPGVGRCQTSLICGPSGVILSARTSLGSIDSLTAVNNGQVDAALVQADAAEAAASGQGPFRRQGALRHVRAIAALFGEDVQLVAGPRINSVTDLVGKRIFLGGAQSYGAVMARSILYAFGVGPGSFRRVESDDPAADLKAGKLDAFFAVTGVPAAEVSQALKDGTARLVPIQGPAAQRLVSGNPQLSAGTIAAGAYPGIEAVPTLSTRAVWVVSDRAPDALVYGITRALLNPANHAALAAGQASAGEIGLARAARTLPLRLHPGAARYYREVGKL